MSTDVSIRGTELKPIILGQIESNEGEFKYKRDFNIRRESFLLKNPPIHPTQG